MYGVWTVLPPILVIVIALVKKDVVASLLIGITAASVIANGLNFLAPIVDEYMLQGWQNNAQLLLTIVIVGVLMGQINACGGFGALSKAIEKRVTTRRGAKLLSWLLCILCATDDGMATVGAGTVARSITDHYRIPREKLAYIVSSTGSNFLSMMPYSMYILFGAGILSGFTGTDGYGVYLKSIPWNFFAIGSILAAGLFAAEILPDFGPMKKREARCMEPDFSYGEYGAVPLLDTDQAPGGDIGAFVIPIAAMLLVFFLSYLRTGTFQMASAALFGAVVAFVYPIIRGQMHFRDISGRVFSSFKSVAPMFMILLLAFTFASAVNDLGFGDYMVALLSGGIPRQFLPAAAFLLGGLVAYCTGSFASGVIIISPVMLPLAGALELSIPLVFAACMGGSQFGDQTSPVSDIFIMSSMASGVDVAQSAQVLLPYKLILFLICAIAYLAVGWILF